MKDISFHDAMSVYPTPEEVWDLVQVFLGSLTICDHKPVICVLESLFSHLEHNHLPHLVDFGM